MFNTIIWRPLSWVILFFPESNPATVHMVNIPEVFYKGLHPFGRWLGMGFLPSTLCSSSAPLKRDSFHINNARDQRRTPSVNSPHLASLSASESPSKMGSIRWCDLGNLGKLDALETSQFRSSPQKKGLDAKLSKHPVARIFQQLGMVCIFKRLQVSAC